MYLSSYFLNLLIQDWKWDLQFLFPYFLKLIILYFETQFQNFYLKNCSHVYVNEFFKNYLQ